MPLPPMSVPATMNIGLAKSTKLHICGNAQSMRLLIPTVVVSVMNATTAPKTKGMGMLASNRTRSIATPMKKLVIIAYPTSDRHEIDIFFA